MTQCRTDARHSKARCKRILYTILRLFPYAGCCNTYPQQERRRPCRMPFHRQGARLAEEEIDEERLGGLLTGTCRSSLMGTSGSTHPGEENRHSVNAA
jgi:hypothetical protein